MGGKEEIKHTHPHTPHPPPHHIYHTHTHTHTHTHSALKQQTWVTVKETNLLIISDNQIPDLLRALHVPATVPGAAQYFASILSINLGSLPRR